MNSCNGRFDEYQALTGNTASYPQENALLYEALGFVGEAGEVANKLKKVLRGDKTVDQVRESVLDEIGDTLWYAARLCRTLGTDLGVVADNNLSKLKDRQERDVIKGDGDKR
jgi:NTP pyrophosphatase (non-canonical NTP hydrolase)